MTSTISTLLLSLTMLLAEFVSLLTGTWVCTVEQSRLPDTLVIDESCLSMSAMGEVYLTWGGTTTGAQVLLTADEDRIALRYTFEGTPRIVYYVRSDEAAETETSVSEPAEAPADVSAEKGEHATVKVLYLDVYGNELDVQQLELGPGEYTVEPTSGKVQGMLFLGPQSATLTVSEENVPSMEVIQFFYQGIP